MEERNSTITNIEDDDFLDCKMPAISMEYTTPTIKTDSSLLFPITNDINSSSISASMCINNNDDYESCISNNTIDTPPNIKQSIVDKKRKGRTVVHIQYEQIDTEDDDDDPNVNNISIDKSKSSCFTDSSTDQSKMKRKKKNRMMKKRAKKLKKQKSSNYYNANKYKISSPPIRCDRLELLKEAYDNDELNNKVFDNDELSDQNNPFLLFNNDVDIIETYETYILHQNKYNKDENSYRFRYGNSDQHNIYSKTELEKIVFLLKKYNDTFIVAALYNSHNDTLSKIRYLYEIYKEREKINQKLKVIISYDEMKEILFNDNCKVLIQQLYPTSTEKHLNVVEKRYRNFINNPFIQLYYMNNNYPNDIEYCFDDLPTNAIIMGYENTITLEYIDNKNKLRSLLYKFYNTNIDLFNIDNLSNQDNNVVPNDDLASFVSYIISIKLFEFYRSDRHVEMRYYMIHDVQIYHDIYNILIEYLEWYVTNNKKNRKKVRKTKINKQWNHDKIDNIRLTITNYIQSDHWQKPNIDTIDEKELLQLQLLGIHMIYTLFIEKKLKSKLSNPPKLLRVGLRRTFSRSRITIH